MATETQRERLRADLDASETSLPDEEADALFVEAGEVYSDEAAQSAQARVIALTRMLAGSARYTNYRQNETQESAGDLFQHFKALLGLWEGRRDAALKASRRGQGVRAGKATPSPSRIREYPGW